MTYQEWIDLYFPTAESAFGKCDVATLAMVAAFPELRRVRGHYECPIWGRRAHWWCVSPKGEIFDPTARQFPSLGLAGEYEEADGGTLVQVGVCMDCGKPIRIPLAEAEQGWRGEYFCSKECENATLAYLNGATFGFGCLTP